MFVSVVIPTYNRREKLIRLLDSLKAQKADRREYEIIVVDDGSTDRTRSAAEDFSSSLKMKYAYQNNQGPSAARNRGYSLAEGEIVLFADDDMIAPSDWIAKFIRAFEANPFYAFIQGGYRYDDRKTIFEEATHYFSWIADKVRIVPSRDFSEGSEALYVGTGNFGVHTKRLRNFELRFDEQLRTREDEDLFRRLEKEKIPVGFSDNPLVHRPSVGMLADIKRFFNYGRGEYLLRQKWGDYVRLQYDRGFRSMRSVFGPSKAFLIQMILGMRTWAWKSGYRWEKELQEKISEVRINKSEIQDPAVCPQEEVFE